MKTINSYTKWIFSSWRNFILTISYLFALYLIVCLFLNYKVVKNEIIHAEESANNIDPILQVRGQSIYLGEDEVYKFIPISGGSLIVTDSTSYRTITVKSFLIGEIEVSNRLQEYIYHKNLVPEGAAEKIMDFPANNGTKENWLEFIDKLNKMTGHTFRLPTNDEWEFAARGGKASLGYKYAGGNNIDAVALYQGNTKELGEIACRLKRPNELGLYDMSGSQWELTSTPIKDVDENTAFLYKLFLMNKEEFQKQHPDVFDDIMKEIENPPFVARGGAWDSPAEECQLDYTSAMHRIKTGARLVMVK